jgi:hypothetical protein
MSTLIENLNGGDVAQAGGIPKTFWINSMGEYGHYWTNALETYGGSINLVEVAKVAGTEVDSIPPEAMERAWSQALHAELIHPVEFAVHRAWKHLSEGLGSDLWRFYAGVEYAERPGIEGVHPNAHSLTMSIEFIVPLTDQQRLGALASRFGAKVELMHEDWEDETKGQFTIDFDVRGKSFGEVADIQARFLLADPTLCNHLVSVL